MERTREGIELLRNLVAVGLDISGPPYCWIVCGALTAKSIEAAQKKCKFYKRYCFLL
jgi:hypothetical protein